MSRLSDEQIVAYTKAAMAPYECVHEFRDYGNRFGYAVYFDDDGSRDVNAELLVRELRHPDQLQRALRDHRERMEAVFSVTFGSWDGIPVQTDC